MLQLYDHKVLNINIFNEYLYTNRFFVNLTSYNIPTHRKCYN